jgi:hypothetical protein
MKTKYPAGYFALRAGDEYIVMTRDGKEQALPIRGLSGQRMVSSFYPNCGEAGYPIRRREATAQEMIAAKASVTVASEPRPALDLSDWK